MRKSKSYSKILNDMMWFMALLLIVFTAGCGSSGGGNNGGGNTDTAAPFVSSTVPANAETGVPINRKLMATFSEAMDSATTTTATFTVIGPGAAPVSGAVTYVGLTATFAPAVNLAASTVYTATITTGARDLAGNALASSYGWAFTTGATEDTTAPTVSSTVPVNTATGVGIGGNIAAIFSEAMDPSTITTANVTLKQGTTPVAGAVTYVGTTAIFNPTSNLAAGTLYTATIATGVKDLAGNALASSYEWTFTTGTAADTTAPTVSSTVPVNTATGVGIGGNIAATFSEAMDPSTITTAHFTLQRGTTPVTGAVTYVGTTATFNPISNLMAGTLYTATIATGVKDLAGNALALAKIWSFTTGTAPDTIAPMVNSTVPADAATGVAINVKPTVIFSEAMDPLTITTANITLQQGTTPVSGTVSYSNKIATFNPTSDLASGATYTGTITTGAKDLAGNALASSKVWSFTTGTTATADPTAPVLGETGRFVVLASQKITTTAGSHISNGDMGIEDQARSYYEGFTAGAGPGQFVELTNGLSYAHDDIDPALRAGYPSTIAFIDQVRTDLDIAYTFLAADPNPTAPTQVCPLELGNLTLTRGVYKTGGNVTIQTGTLHLDAQNDPNSVWIFTIDGTLATGAPGGSISLDNGAQAKNVYWRTAGTTIIGTNTAFYGNVFSWPQVNVLTGASVTGRLFSVTEQVTLDANAVTKAP